MTDAPQLTWLECSAQLKPGTRVEFAEPHDIFPEALVPAGTQGTIEENGLNEIWGGLLVLPDSAELQSALVAWDGMIYLGSGVTEWGELSPLRITGVTT